jgi:hypothetical protein
MGKTNLVLVAVQGVVVSHDHSCKEGHVQSRAWSHGGSCDAWGPLGHMRCRRGLCNLGGELDLSQVSHLMHPSLGC